MKTLGNVDYGIIIFYFVAIMMLGFWMSRKASSSLDDYYLGGRKLPWWLLGASGMAQWFDITGTTLICSFLFMMGPRGLFIEFRGGACLVLVFMMVVTGKWHRRSGVMTGAEWNVFRFGTGPDAEFARLTTALTTLLMQVGMVAYLARGVGIFLSMFLPFGPTQCSVGLCLLVTIYTVAAGFYGVVLTDLVQSVIIVLACVFVSAMGFVAIAHTDIGDLAARVVGNTNWTTSLPTFKAKVLQGYEAYDAVFVLMIFYFVRNMLGGLGQSGMEPKYFGARSDRECGLLSMLVAIMIMFRWPLMMGFAVMGLFMVDKLFPDPAVIAQASELIKEFHPDIAKSAWHDLTNRILNNPGGQPDALIAGLKSTLGPDWADKIRLVGYESTLDPERVLPAVILQKIPLGFRGLMLVALIAASMSTFDSMINMGSAFFVRDIYQRWLRPHAKNRELIGASYITTTAIMILGLIMGLMAENINDIWDWIIMGLTAGLLAPGLLRLYWWRFNGWGVAGGLVLGGAGALFQRAVSQFFPADQVATVLEAGDPVSWLNRTLFFVATMGPVNKFVMMLTLSFLGAVPVALLTKPTADKILVNFYRRTRCFGLWSQPRKFLDDDFLAYVDRENRNDLIAIPVVLVWQILLFLIPMQIIIHSWSALAVTLPIWLASCVGVYYLWYRKLPEDVLEPEDVPVQDGLAEDTAAPPQS